MSAPTLDSLKALFILLNLPTLAEELESTPAKYALFLARSEPQWERRYGDAGIDIYNHLHPQQQGEVGRVDQTLNWEIFRMNTCSLDYSCSAEVFKLSTEYLSGSGVKYNEVDSVEVLYCRPLFHEQFEFMQNKVVEGGCLGIIYGPPGCGKSTTALAFASTLDREKEWIITWIHLSRNYRPLLVHFDGLKKKVASEKNPDNIEKFLYSTTKASNKKHIVFLDGYVTDPHLEYSMMCASWRKKFKDQARFVTISSMSSQGKRKDVDDSLHEVEFFPVFSWTLEEFKDAAKETSFVEAVKDVFKDDPYIDSSDDINDQLESKFFFAGGSARFMFMCPTKAVIDQLKTATAAVNDVALYFQNSIGDQSSLVKNILCGSLRRSNGDSITLPASRFVGRLISSKLKVDTLKQIVTSLEASENAIVNGLLMELHFFALLRQGRCSLKPANTETDILWKSTSEIKMFDPTLIKDDKEQWFYPKIWNQGGFDAICINKSENLVRLVQVTSSEKHSFKIHCFRKFLDSIDIEAADMKLEIFFVVDIKYLHTFQFYPVTGHGRLEKYGVKRYGEIEFVKIAGLKWS